MGLSDRIKASMFVSQQEKLILSVLASQEMTPQELVGCLMSDPYDLTFKEVLDGLQRLFEKGLVELGKIEGNESNFEIRTYLTFACDWRFKL